MALYAIANGDICLVTWFGKLDGQVIMNTFHYKNTFVTGAADGPAELTSLMNKIKANIWTAEWKGRVSVNYQLQVIQAQIIYPTRRVYSRLNVNEDGTQVTTALPSFNQACITRYGSIAGRGRSASLQIAGLVTSQVTGSEINDASMPNFQDIADAVASNQQDLDGNPDAWTPINWTLGHAAQSNFVRGCTVHRQVRTEKRRVVGQGI